MGVGLNWKPTDRTRGKDFAAGSQLHGILEHAFGTFPVTLTRKDIGKLEGIWFCGYQEVQELINAILEFDSVDVEAEW